MTAALPLVRPNVHVKAASVAAAFMLNGMSFGLWAARIPAVTSADRPR